MKKANYNKKTILLPSELSIGRAAMLLAITPTREEEEDIKRVVHSYSGNYKCAITEVSGKISDYEEKVTHAVLGASLNCEVIKKETQQIHALLHATMEASEGMAIGAPMSANLVIKIGIVSSETWIAVAMFGQFAYHSLATHERAGLGIMHLERGY